MKSLSLVLLLVVASTAILAAPSQLQRREVNPDYGALDSLTDLWNMLKRAAEIGNEELRKVLDDPRVDALIDRLTGFAKRTALKAIQYFKNLLDKPQAASAFQFSSPQAEEAPSSLHDATLVDKFFDLVFAAKNSGQEELKKTLESTEILSLLDELKSEKVKQFLLDYIEELGGAEEVLEPISDESTSDASIVKELFHALTVAASAGKDALLKVLRDPKIRESVNNLGLFAKTSALKILNYFESKLQSEPQPISDESSFSVLRQVYSLLDRARKESMIALKNTLQSEELSRLIAKLPERYLSTVQNYVAFFAKFLEKELEEEKILSMIAVADTADGSSSEEEDEELADMIAYASTVESLDQEDKVTVSEILRLIRRYLDQAALEGQEKLQAAWKSDYVQTLVGKLPLSVRLFLNRWLN
jgi:hypothetical protein